MGRLGGGAGGGAGSHLLLSARQERANAEAATQRRYGRIPPDLCGSETKWETILWQAAHVADIRTARKAGFCLSAQMEQTPGAGGNQKREHWRQSPAACGGLFAVGGLFFAAGGCLRQPSQIRMAAISGLYVFYQKYKESPQGCTADHAKDAPDAFGRKRRAQCGFYSL